MNARALSGPDDIGAPGALGLPAGPVCVNLDDVSRCPLGLRCESCGAESGDVTVATADLGRLGVACFSLCARCRRSTVPPRIAVGTAMRLVGQHCVHLGIDVDQMAAVLAVVR